MARRIRWQIVIAVMSALLVTSLLGNLALSQTAQRTPRAGGSYIEAITGTPVQPVPLLNDPLNDPAGRDLGALLFDGLTRLGPDGLPGPALAQSWEIDSSGEVYTFNLRRDVTWHDGQPFTANDVVFTLQAIQSADFSGDPALSNLWRNVLVDRLDDYTVRCTLSAPYAPFLSSARVPILPVHLLGSIPLDQWATSSYARSLVGTGPYQLAELSTDRAVLDANNSYFQRPPLIDQIELRFIETPAAALSAISRGEAQSLGYVVTADLSQVSLPRTLRQTTLPLDAYTILSFNLRDAPLDNVDLRQALAHALDKTTLIETAMAGQAASIDTPILPGWWAYNPDTSWYAYDPATAQDMLADLGYRTGQDSPVASGEALMLPLLTDEEPGRLAAAEEIARQWGTIGVQVNVEVVDSVTLRERLREHDFVMSVHSWARLGADPDVFELWHSSQAGNGLNYAGLRDDAIDRLLVNGRTELELSARNEEYAAFQQRWIDLAPAIPLYQSVYTFASSETVGGFGFAGDRIGGIPLLIGPEDRYRNVTRWFVNSSQEIRGNLR